MSTTVLLKQLKEKPESVEFDYVMEIISDNYDYTPSRFSNGDTINEAGTNEGSCKILYFAQLNKLSKEETLSLFGKYYQNDVLGNPTGGDHTNIRNFMKDGWAGITFNSIALKVK